MEEKKNIWDLSHLLNGLSKEEIEKNIMNLSSQIKGLRDSLSDDILPSDLLEIIRKKEALGVFMRRLNTHLSMRFSENTKDPDVLAYNVKLSQLFTDIQNDTMFFSLWFMNLSDSVATKLMNSNELKDYKYYLSRIREEKIHTMSEEVEKIINIKSETGGDVFADLYDLFTSSFRFEAFGKKDLVIEEITSNFQDYNPEIREEAYDVLLSKFKDESTIIAEMYKNIVVDWDNESLKIRNYDSPIQVRNKSNQVSDETVKALIDTVRKNVHVFQEYFKLKYELNKRLGDTYAYSRYHVYAPVKSSEEKNYSYEDAKSIVLELFKSFDEEFFLNAKKIFDMNHVHSHPAPYKRSGAFCSSPFPDMEPYILLNHTGKLRDVYTMAHEFGHGIHGIFASDQNFMNYDEPLVMAETASVFAEMLLTEKLLKDVSSDREKIAILARQLHDEYATILRQVYFCVFEIFAHDNIKSGLTKDEIDKKYYALLKEQFGDMQIPEKFKHEWNYIPHIHHTPFYVYAYAWGNLMVLSLYKMYKEQGDAFIPKYKDILRAGGSDAPENILKRAGIDIASEGFWQKGMDQIKEQISLLKKLSEKI
ncbi:M3 family oligoendopeptidase [Candidatus Woesearchaeota archaeon]|nr:M3 family oligoendopeptidase [Candidatus Woesearchaeota archaeon]